MGCYTIVNQIQFIGLQLRSPHEQSTNPPCKEQAKHIIINGKNARAGSLRYVYHLDCRRSIYQNSHTGCALYAAVSVYHDGRTAAGGRPGAASVGVYIILGLAGMPVFAEGGGIWYLAKPSFGYILGFCLASFVTGSIVERLERVTLKGLLAANFTGLFIVYAIGMLYYYIISNYVIHTPIGLWPLFFYCFILAVPGDICLCILAAFLAKRMRPVIKRGWQ